MSSSLYTFDDLDTSPIRYQIDQLVPDGVTTGFIWGRRTVGKTLLAINAALAIGNGIPFMGHKTTRGRTVLIAGEGFGGIGIRIEAELLKHEHDKALAVAEVARTQGDEAAREYAASLPPYTADNLIIMDKRFPLHFTRADKPGDTLEQVMRELTLLNTPGPDDDPETFPYITWVILDALANFKGQLSLANDSSAGRITDTMHWMAEQLQCCVTALAHPTADGKKMLGAERLGNSADFVIRIEPDEVSAPGALKTATVSSEKSKDGNEFSPFGYQVRTWTWDEPVRDENDQPTGETEEVSSATVELIEAEQPSRKAGRPPLPLPAFREPPPAGRQVRNGLKQNRNRTGLYLVQPAAEEQAAAPAPRPAPAPVSKPPSPLIAGMLGVQCGDCGRPAGMGCDVTVAGSGLVPLSLDPVLAVHADRIVDAAIAGRVDFDKATAWIGGRAKIAPVPPPVPPAVPVKVPSDVDKRLWWTTVRPDQEGGPS